MIEPAIQPHVAVIDPVGAKAGLEEYDAHLAAALRSNGVKVSVLNDSGDISAALPPFFRFEQTRNLLSAVRLWKEFRNAIDWCVKEHVTHVLIHVFSYSRFDEWLLRSIRSRSIRTIVLVHDVEPFLKPASSSRRNRILGELSDFVLVHNRFTAEELFRLSGLSKAVEVIPHGNFIDPSRIQPDKKAARKRLGIPESAFCPLFFGMIKPTKGLEACCRAMELLPSDVVLLVAGRVRGRRGSDLSLLRRLEESGRAVSRIGFIPPLEMEEWMAAADCILLPYERSYQSGVAIQAMSRKIPVILSDIAPHRQWLEEGAQAWMIPVRDPVRLAAAVDGLRNDPRLAGSLAEKAFVHLSEAHDWQIPARIIRNLVSQV